MESDVIALLVAVALGVVVVIVGLWRDLSETMRGGLPRFEQGSGGAIATTGPCQGEKGRRRSLSPGERRWLGSSCVLFALIWGAIAVLSGDLRVLHAILAVAWAIMAVASLTEKWPPSANRSSF